MSAFYSLILICLSTFAFAGDFEQGLAFAKTKKWDEAQQHFAKYLQEHPHDSRALFNQALCLENQNNFAAAIWHFEKAYKYDPTIQEAILQIEYCHKKLNNIYTWSSPFSAFKIQVLRIKMNAWMWICLNMSITLGVCIFMYFVSKKYKKPALFAVIFGSGLLVTALYCMYQKDAIENSLTHGIMTKKAEAVFVDKNGFGLMPYSVRAGERVELVEAGKRIGVRFSNGLVAWVEPAQIRLY